MADTRSISCNVHAATFYRGPVADLVGNWEVIFGNPGRVAQNFHPVDKGDVQPGDLVIWRPPNHALSHVGVAVGRDRVSQSGWPLDDDSVYRGCLAAESAQQDFMAAKNAGRPSDDLAKRARAAGQARDGTQMGPSETSLQRMTAVYGEPEVLRLYHPELYLKNILGGNPLPGLAPPSRTPPSPVGVPTPTPNPQ